MASCASCHGTNLKAEGKHVITDRKIAPLSPAANPERFADLKKVEKWFKRNCKEVAGRECTAAEKGGLHPVCRPRSLSMNLKMLAVLTLVSGSPLAHADRVSVPDHPKWKAECGSCHLAFPPQLLTKDNWGWMMEGMDKHFGADASLDAKDAQDILGYLQRHAGTGGKYSAPSLKISDTPWFPREHSKVSGRAWSGPAVKSRSNCIACHVGAEKGDWFDERSIRMPAGLR
jgi:cytochrome c553